MKLKVADRYAGPMNEEEVLDFLQRERVLMRLAMVDDDGYPMAHPVWFVYEDNCLWAAVERTSRKAKVLRKNSKVYFTIDKSTEPPKGVRGRGTATLIEDDSLALKVTTQHLLKYHGAIDDEFAKNFLDGVHELAVVRVAPIFLASWDYAKRRRLGTDQGS